MSKPVFCLRKTILTLKMPRNPASENVVCLCRLLNILANFSNLFLHSGKQCGPWSDCSWTGSTLFAKKTFKIISRWQSRRQLLWLAVLGLKFCRLKLLPSMLALNINTIILVLNILVYFLLQTVMAPSPNSNSNSMGYPPCFVSSKTSQVSEKLVLP